MAHRWKKRAGSPGNFRDRAFYVATLLGWPAEKAQQTHWLWGQHSVMRSWQVPSHSSRQPLLYENCSSRILSLMMEGQDNIQNVYNTHFPLQRQALGNWWPVNPLQLKKHVLFPRIQPTAWSYLNHCINYACLGSGLPLTAAHYGPLWTGQDAVLTCPR